MYNSLNSDDIKYLKSVVPASNFIEKENLSEDFSKDELGTVAHYPDVMIYVENAKQISKILAYANTNYIPVVVRGSGTGLVGSCVPIHGGIVINTTKMNHILSIDEDNLTLTVEPGVLLMDIYEYVEAKGLFYAPDPGEKTATIGGNISTNAGGMRAVKWGTTRDWVRSLEVVLPNGKIETFGRNVVKDSTGYSLKNLIIGSEGTLAVVTKAVLRLEPKPNESISLLIPFETKEHALDAVPNIIKAKVSPTAIEFFERNTISFAEEYLGKKFPDSKNIAYLLLTFDGLTKDQLTENYKTTCELCINELHAIDALIVDTAERKDSVWKARGAFLEAIKASTTQMDECDVVVPRSKVADFIKFTYEVSKKYNIRIPSFGHAGDGNLHIYICKDEYSNEEFTSILDKVFNDLYTEAKNVGGLVSGEHGIGFAKKKYIKEILGEEQINLMKQIKLAFDPHNILNAGKIFD